GKQDTTERALIFRARNRPRLELAQRAHVDAIVGDVCEVGGRGRDRDALVGAGLKHLRARQHDREPRGRTRIRADEETGDRERRGDARGAAEHAEHEPRNAPAPGNDVYTDVRRTDLLKLEPSVAAVAQPLARVFRKTAPEKPD